MKGLGGTSPFHRFPYPRRDKPVYFWLWASYLLYMHHSKNKKEALIESEAQIAAMQLKRKA